MSEEIWGGDGKGRVPANPEFKNNFLNLAGKFLMSRYRHTLFYSGCQNIGSVI